LNIIHKMNESQLFLNFFDFNLQTVKGLSYQ
jgi:hypothetical protein